MKNERLVEAISEIDDDLLEDALVPVKKPLPIWRTVLPAACAAAIVGAVVMFNFTLGSTEKIQVFGEKITYENSLFLKNAGGEYAPRTASQMCVIPLEISGKGTAALSAESGELSAKNKPEGQQCFGAECEVSLPAKLFWSVNLDDTSKVHTLHIKTQKTDLAITVEFDEIEQDWSVKVK